MPPPSVESVIPQLDGNNSTLISSQSESSFTSLSLSFTSSCCSTVQSSLAAEDSWFSQVSMPHTHSKIPVVFGHRTARIIPERPPPSYRVIRRDYRCAQARSLPSFILYNMRSIWAKQKNFSADMQERSAELVFLSEIWEKSDNRKHQEKIVEM